MFCRGKVNTVSLESQQFFPGFLCAGRAWFGSVSRRRSLMRDATEEEGQPTLGVTECNRGLCVCALFWFYITAPPEHSLSRCSETAGEVWKGLGFGVEPFRLQKTAATARITPGDGHSDSVVPPAFFF